jgi:O-antigen/teichoic acid export membrane protein
MRRVRSAPVDAPAAARRGIARLRTPGSGPQRAVLTTLDQSFASLSNFAVGIVVARVSGAAGLGAYSVAYAIWLAIAAAHRALITDPMSIDNDARQADAAENLRAGVAAELTFGVALAIVLVAVGAVVGIAGGRDVAVPLVTLAIFLPFLLVQDYWRWVGFMQARPARSLANDTVFNVVQAAGLVVFILSGLRSPSVAIAAWGLGALAAAAFGLRQFSVVPAFRGGLAMIGSRWSMSRWLLASGAAGWGGNQAYPILAAPAVGASGVGGLKAAQSLVSGPSLVLIQAGGSMGLPEAADAFERGGWTKLRRVANWVTIAGVLSVGLVTVIVVVAGHTLLNAIYGPEFVKYATTANIIAFGWLIQALGLGAILVLKVTRQTRLLFHVSIISLVSSAVTLVVFSYAWGVEGAAWAMTVGSTITLFALLWSQRVSEREFALLEATP